MFGLKNPEDKEAGIFVKEVEPQADEILGPYGKKEFYSMMKICGREV